MRPFVSSEGAERISQQMIKGFLPTVAGKVRVDTKNNHHKW